MSQANSGGPVVIPFVADRSGVDSFIAEIRKGYDMPIRAQFVGPGGPGGAGGVAGGSMSVATANGPTTFASQSGGGAGSFVGPGGAGGWVGPAGIGGGMGGFTIGAGATGGMGGGATQLNQATSQLASVVNQLSQVVGQIGSGAATAASAAGAGGGISTIGGLRAGRLAQYATAGFMLREGLSGYRAATNYSNEIQMAGNNPAAQLSATMGFYNKLAGIPVVGQLADIIVDPAGNERLAIQRTVESAQFGEDYMMGMVGLRTQVSRATDQAGIAQFPSGPQRSRLEAESRYKQRTGEIAIQRINDPLYRSLNDQREKEKAEVQHQWEKEMAELRMSGEGVVPPSLEENMQKQLADRLGAVDAADAKRRGPLDEQYKKLTDAAESQQQGELDVIKNETKRQMEGWGFARERSNALSKRYVNREEVWRIQRREDKMVAGYLDISMGNNAGAWYLDAQAAKEGHERADFAKQSAREVFSIGAETERLNLLSGRDVRSQYQGPGMRGFMAELSGLVSSNQAAIEEALQAGKPDVAEALKARGRAGVIGMRQRFYDSISTESGDPFLQILTGPGTSDMRSMSADFWKAFNDAQRAGGGPTNLSEGGGGSGDNKAVSENTKQIGATLNQVFGLLQSLLPRININA